MNSKIVTDDPTVFKYQDPMGKGTYLSILVGALFFIGAVLYAVLGFLFMRDEYDIKIAMYLVAAAFVITIILPARSAKGMMNVRAEFTKWSVMNYGLTPLEFLINKSVGEGTQGRILLSDLSTTKQKFLDTDVNTVEVRVTQDRHDYKKPKTLDHPPYVKVTIDAPRLANNQVNIEKSDEEPAEAIS